MNLYQSILSIPIFAVIIFLFKPDLAHAQSDISYYTNRTRSQFDSLVSSEASQNRRLHDIEIEKISGNTRYCAVFAPKPSGVTFHYLIQEDSSAWSSWLSSMGSKNGRFLDIEVDYFDGNKRYSGIFYEDGDNYAYAIHTTNTDSQFQTRLGTYQANGRQIVDFEAYSVGGTTYYAGLWANDPNQPITALYYGLESADVSQLLRPLEGRVIDFERYYSETHSEIRYALIVAMQPGDEWALHRGYSSSGLVDLHNSIADSNTRLVDIEMWDSSGGALRAGVWGDNFGPLLEVSAMPGDSNRKALTGSLASLVNSFENVTTDVSGQLGFYARNLTTGESLGYREDTMFYLASCAKVAMHIKLYQEIQAGNVDLTDTVAYSNGTTSLDPWFVDQRPLPGMSPCLCGSNGCTGFRTSDMGQDITVDRIDRGMMEVSDNAATGMLLDNDVWGLSEVANPDLNEWMASIDGVNRGFGPVTSIRRLDRLIMWQGQVMNAPSDPSVFGTDTHLLEQLFRFGSGVDTCTDRDNDGVHDLAQARGGSFPSINYTEGYERYYRTNLNSATPRAFVNLLDKFWNEEFLDSQHTQDALDVMRVGAPGSVLGTPLDNSFGDSWNEITVYAKGGSKGGASNPRINVGFLEFGDQVIALTIATQNNVSDPNPPAGEDGDEDINRVYMPDITMAIVRALSPDLTTFNTSESGGGTTTGTVEPTSVEMGRNLYFEMAVKNNGDRTSGPFKIHYFLSTNETISISDSFLGTVQVQAVPGSGNEIIRSELPVPNMDEGSYFLGWIIDRFTEENDFWGDVGEYEENNNIGYLISPKVTITAPEQEGLIIY